MRFHNAAFDMLTRQAILTDAPAPLALEFNEANAWSEQYSGPAPDKFERIRETYLRAAADALTIPGTMGPTGGA